jgi:hypothetical protein
MNRGTGLPVGAWTHSFEEDEGDIQVYRPSAAFPFPPARRPRDTLVFHPDGTASIGVPGPDDRQQHTPVAVTALGMNRFRFDGGALAGEVEVLEHSPGILRLRRG